MASGSQFEEKVRKIARALWGDEPGVGSPELVDGRERDVIIPFGDVVHYVECTTLRTKAKAEYDCDKLSKYRARELKRGVTVVCWLVTEREPTADQLAVARAANVNCLSASQFRRKLIDGDRYLFDRERYPFGSARDPENNDSEKIDRIRYQPVRFLKSDIQKAPEHESQVTIEDIGRLLVAGSQVAMLGDFGMGKSIAIYQIFRYLANRYRGESNNLFPVPVVLNLREHWGQSEPYEALERHARALGIAQPSQLVRAFNAGQLIIMLDGFDEIANQSWDRGARDSGKHRRADAVRLVKAFAERARGKCGLLVAGREHFFDANDDRRELAGALGFEPKALAITLREFSEDEAAAFLKAREIDVSLPPWIPRRPLLLAKLTSEDLRRVLEETADRAPADAWDRLIDAVCAREKKIHEYLDKDAIRAILEGLASAARATATGLGPITETIIAEEFRRQTDAFPDSATLPLLGRLPGLSAREAQAGTRMFIDGQMVDILRAAVVGDFAMGYAKTVPFAQQWQCGLGAIGAQFVANKMVAAYEARGATRLLVSRAKEAARTLRSGTLAADCIVSALRIAIELEETVDCDEVVLSEAYISELDLGDTGSIERATFQECVIEHLTLGPTAPRIRFQGCTVGRLDGWNSSSPLPEWLGAKVEAHGSAETNSDVLADERLSLPVRVLLVALRKLYLQRGAGRKESAFYRGGLSDEARAIIPTVLAELKRECLADSISVGGGTVWLPIRSATARVHAVLRAPRSATDPILDRVKSISTR